MRNSASIRVATIRGVDLRIHFSLIFILLYVAFVAYAQFPLVVRESGVAADQLRGGPGAWGLLFAVSLFVSVALHEYGHAFMAQAQGVKVRGITLMMLGGVSEMEKMPDQPYAEFKLAIVGPLVSLGLAGLLLAVHAVTRSPGLSFFSYWLGSANLVLAIFNLLPAFPLDGGRALRSFLSVRQGPIRATQSSVRISKSLAWVLGILGFLQFNIILVLIAFFIHAAAQSELYMMFSKGLLEGIRVSDVAIRLAPVHESENLQEVATRMISSRQAVLPVETDSGIPALISFDDLRGAERRRWSTTPVRTVMQPVPKALDVNDSVSQALPEIAMTAERALPVRENGRMVGVVTHGHLTELLQLKTLEHEATRDRDRDRERPARAA